MRARLAAVLCVIFLLSGCSNGGSALDRAIALRNKILNGDGCSFQATVTADYGEKIYVFSLNCEADKNGDLSFTVASPATIKGISGKISGTGGSISFDDVVLAFPTIADGQITPVTAPWLFVKTLRGGYLKDCSLNDDGFSIAIDDSYSEEAFQLNINTKGDTPISAEIFWKGRRILTLSVENFVIV